jgi:hypothetical protein
VESGLNEEGLFRAQTATSLNNGADATARTAEALDEALKLGRSMAAAAQMIARATRY